jgi:branched-chain amino acid transport system permease protein
MSRGIALALAVIVLATVPLWVVNDFYVKIVSQVLIYAVFALSLNVLVGYAGLVSLGHAGLFGVACYTVAWLIANHWGQLPSALIALGVIIVTSAIFAILSLRATGIGFLMITLAIGQILWGLAYRWIGLTGGDNGINVPSLPSLFGFSLAKPRLFYCFALIVFLTSVAAMAIFIRSPFGASVKGTRDQPRRMTALGYNVWLIRFLAFLFSGFWSGVAGLLFCYYNQFVSPNVMALSSSAEALLMVISGGTGTLLGPIAGAALVVIMKNVVSAYIERWNFVLGAIFVAIVIFVPEGLVPGSVRLWRWSWSRLQRRRDEAVLRAGGGGGG